MTTCCCNVYFRWRKRTLRRTRIGSGARRIARNLPPRLPRPALRRKSRGRESAQRRRHQVSVRVCLYACRVRVCLCACSVRVYLYMCKKSTPTSTPKNRRRCICVLCMCVCACSICVSVCVQCVCVCWWMRTRVTQKKMKLENALNDHKCYWRIVNYD